MFTCYIGALRCECVIVNRIFDGIPFTGQFLEHKFVVLLLLPVNFGIRSHPKKKNIWRTIAAHRVEVKLIFVHVVNAYWL